MAVHIKTGFLFAFLLLLERVLTEDVSLHFRRDFEEVKSSGGSSQHTSSRAQEAPRLALDNKFAALRN